MKVYISGPMVGIADHNFPAFHAAAKRWRDNGDEVFGPAELNPGPADMNVLAACDVIFMLSGWEKSRAAVTEKRIAEGLKMDVYCQ